MKKYNYYYDGQPILELEFSNFTPDDWEEDVDEFGCYSYGYYEAILIDD